MRERKWARSILGFRRRDCGLESVDACIAPSITKETAETGRDIKSANQRNSLLCNRVKPIETVRNNFGGQGRF